MNHDHIRIREIKPGEVQKIATTFCFPWSTPEETSAKWTAYAVQHQEVTRTVFLIEYQEELIGYGSLLYISEYPRFKEENIPEIHDVWILEKFRHHGFGKQLLFHLEKIAIGKGYSRIGIGVGLYKDYGPAQILYIKLGYIPDGRGIMYNGSPVTPGEAYPVDDDLNLYLLKTLV